MDVPAVVGTNHHSNEIATTTSQQPLQIHLCHTQVKAPHNISGLIPVSCSHHYSKPGHIPVYIYGVDSQ